MARRTPNPQWDFRDSLLDGKPAATLDLHGQTKLQAEASVRSFLQAAARAHAGKVVHVITGKGKGSAGGAVLKTAARSVIKAAGPVVADWAEDVDGGGWLVRLR